MVSNPKLTILGRAGVQGWSMQPTFGLVWRQFGLSRLGMLLASRGQCTGWHPCPPNNPNPNINSVKVEKPRKGHPQMDTRGPEVGK